MAAGPRPPLPRTGVEVFVLTFGPGDHPFSKFGHNAVLVVDHLRRTDRVYNFGTFSARSPTLLSDFMQGKLSYWVSVSRQQSTLAAYASDNRNITAQRLNLTPMETAALLEALRVNALPENRFYRYDYYLDNCSTKVRDVLDEILGGRLQGTKQKPARLSWREHTSRLTASSLWVNLGLNVALAGKVDEPRSRWEEMFLPSVLRDELNRVSKLDGTPLVAEQQSWFRAERPPLPNKPPRWSPWLLLSGAMLGAAALALAHLGKRHSSARVALLALAALLGTVTGVLGSIFALFWLVTDHSIAHANENLLLFPPWALALPISVVVARMRRSWVGLLRKLSLLLAVGSAVALLLKALPGFGQDNWMFLAFGVPLWSMLALALHRWSPGPEAAIDEAPNPSSLTQSPRPRKSGGSGSRLASAPTSGSG